MKTRWKLPTLVVLASVVSTRLVAAEPKSDEPAKARAALYQTEVSVELTWQHWHVTTNNPGRLVATHLLPPEARGNDPLGYVSLVVTFKPRSKTDTECGINKVLYLYGSQTGNQFHKTFQGPYVQTDPAALRDVNDLLGKARRRMFKAHPEYAAPASR